MSTPSLNQPDRPDPMADFPVQWADAAEEERTWLRDTVHFPTAITHMDFTLLVKSMEHGINHAAATYALGFLEEYKYLNGYVYESTALPLLSAEESAAQAQRAEQQIEAAMGELGYRWEQIWLPEIQTHLTTWQEYDLANASLTDLLAHLAATLPNYRRLWEIHFLLFYPMMLTLNAFTEMVQELFPESDPFAAYTLLRGENQTTRSHTALARLCHLAQEKPLVGALLREQPAARVLAELANSTDGQLFLDALRAYLQSYGRCSDRVSLSAPFWLEDPTLVLRTIQERLTHPQPSPDDTTSGQTAADSKAHREAALARVRDALAGYPEPVIAQFEGLYGLALVSYQLSEDHNFWIDNQGNYHMRQLLRTIGERLTTQKILETPEDLFSLTLDEVQSSSAGAAQFQSLIAERRAQATHFAAVVPPPLLGAPPTAMPDDPFVRALTKFFGGPPPEAQAPNEVGGYAGAPGVVQGTARIARTLAEADRILPGEILVAPTTTPAWSTLFGYIGAIVTDSGGILSHCAVVAREYGIPAVVGTAMATALLQDGQWIEVDGTHGVVRIL